MASSTRELNLVGGDSDLFRAMLDEDICFGQHYATSAPECQECCTPVIVDSKIVLLRDVCKAECLGGGGGTGLLKRLPSREVINRLQAGIGLQEIFEEILNGTDEGVAARQLLSDRLWYIEKEMGMPVPDLPHTAELMEARDGS